MVVDLVGGAALGAAFGLLFDAVEEMVKKTLMFKGNLKNIRGTLKSLEPLIKEIKEFNMELDLSQEETIEFELKIKEGVKLVRKCSKVGRWNICKKPHYSDKLIELDETLKRLVQILKMQSIRDGKEILKLVRGIDTRLSPRIGSTPSWCDVPQLPLSIIVGLDAPLEELKSILLNNGPPLLVVTAPGGCGKTLLAQMLCLDDQVQENFKKNIFFVRLSKTPPSLHFIVQQLYKHVEYEVPFPLNEADAIKHLEQLLNDIGKLNPTLLVLDDVWPQSESIVENFALQVPGSGGKILVTTKFSLPLLGPPKYGPPYHLNPLNDKDLMTLFHHWASLEQGRSHIPDGIVKKIVNSYKVSPHVLKVVAGSLSGQPLEVWLRKLREWSEGSSRLGSDENEMLREGSSRLGSDENEMLREGSSRLGSDENEMLPCLQSCLDDLKPIVRECFVDLASFPEGQRISAGALMDMWTALYDIEDSAAIANLFNLTIRHLANLVVSRKEKVNGYYGDHFVTQHNLLRDLAIHQSSQGPVEQRKKLFVELIGDELPEWLKEHEDQPFAARLLSISTDEMFSSKWWDMELPEAEAFVLNFRTKDYSLPEFVEKMIKLKVLIIRNASPFDAHLSNLPLLGSLTNLRTMRLERISIPSLINTSSVVPLNSLKEITLFMCCNIGEAFRKGSILISDMMPNLRAMNLDFCSDLMELPAGFHNIIPMEELSITNCSKLPAVPEEIGNLINLRALMLVSCESLRELPSSIYRLPKLTQLSITNCSRVNQWKNRSIVNLEKESKDLTCDEE